jgi:hypothetical protein
LQLEEALAAAQARIAQLEQAAAHNEAARKTIMRLPTLAAEAGRSVVIS